MTIPTICSWEYVQTFYLPGGDGLFFLENVEKFRVFAIAHGLNGVEGKKIKRPVPEGKGGRLGYGAWGGKDFSFEAGSFGGRKLEVTAGSGIFSMDGMHIGVGAREASSWRWRENFKVFEQ